MTEQESIFAKLANQFVSEKDVYKTKNFMYLPSNDLIVLISDAITDENANEPPDDHIDVGPDVSYDYEDMQHDEPMSQVPPGTVMDEKENQVGINVKSSCLDETPQTK